MGWSPTEMYLYSASTPLGNFSASSQQGHQWHSYTKGVKTEKNYTRWNKYVLYELVRVCKVNLCNSTQDETDGWCSPFPHPPTHPLI